MKNNLDNYYPLSFQQKRIWWGSKVAKDDLFNNVPLRFELDGPLNEEVLLLAINQVVTNHQILRTRIDIINGEIVQKSSDNLIIPLSKINLLDQNFETSEKKIKELIQIPFELNSHSGLIRTYLIEKAKNQHTFLMVSHHILLDGPSITRLIEELSFAYNSILNSSTFKLTVPKFDYSDFVFDQLSFQNSDTFLNGKNYWFEKLKDISASNIFENNLNDENSQLYADNLYKFKIEKEKHNEILGFCKKYKITPFIFFVSIYQVLLHLLTCEETVLLALPISKRENEELEKLIGLVSNVVPIPFHINRDIKFYEFANETKKQLFDALEYSHIPIESVQKDLQLTNKLNIQDYFRLMVVYNDYSKINLQLNSIASKYIESFTQARSDLLFSINQYLEDLIITFEYKTQFFSKEYIENLAERFELLINQFLNNPNLKIADANIILPREKFLLNDFSKGDDFDYEFNKSIIDLFDEIVANSPNVIAVVDNDREYSYQEIDIKSKQLAQHLKTKLVTPGDVIGVMFKRSINVYISILAILRLGGIYLPIDPKYPSSRIKFIIDKIDPKLILTSIDFEAILDFYNEQVLVLNDEIFSSLSKVDLDSINIEKKQTNNCCYILFTSGSTGIPKAVRGSQKGLLNRLHWVWKKFPLKKNDICCNITSIGFIDSITEMLTPLLGGITQVVLNEEVTQQAELFVENLIRNNVTRLVTVPSLLRFFAQSFKQKKNEFFKLNTIIVSGEEVDVTLVKKYGEILPTTKIINFYGSTEVNGDVTSYEINNHTEYHNFIPIGKPIHNTEVYLLNKYDQLTPLGTKGEICIAGLAVNLGYFDEQENLESKFTYHPLAKGLMYKTGDFGVYLPDGNIKYLGRQDSLIKIYGHRVETKEIYNALISIPEINDAYLTLIKEDNRLDIRAYICANTQSLLQTYNNHENIIKFIRSKLKESVPFYMVPTTYALFDTFPMLPNNKLDIKTLTTRTNKQEDDWSHKSQYKFIELISKIWKQALELEHIDVKRTFFELGGNSLLLVHVFNQILNSLPQTITLKLSIVDLFSYPDITSFANYLEFLSREDQDIITSNTPQKTVEPIREDFCKDIAIIGVSCRFPGASNEAELWNNLKQGVESINFFDGLLNNRHIDDNNLNSDLVIRATAELEDVDKFDNEFFGYTAHEAKLMDPQHRILLEESWKALENAGYVSEKYEGEIAILVGSGDSRYFINNILLNGKISSTSSFDVDFWSTSHLNSTQFLATKIAHKLNLTGPALNVTTACSTSLVTIAMACDMLRLGKANMALAGGVSLVLPDDKLAVHQQGSILSPDGHCRPFSSDANGTIMGSGVGVVVLKRLSDAIKDKDNILAVIKAVAVNNDGANKINYTAPSVEGQANCVKKAFLDAGVSSDTISYVETHGTGTALGDPIEINALTKAFTQNSKFLRKNYCAVGSIKANIGHANIAAGVASVIKTILCLKHKELVPLINYKSINPQIDIQNTPFYINKDYIEWETDNIPRRASINSLGIGGTNAHMILEEWIGSDDNTIGKEKHYIFCFSARSTKSLEQVLLNNLAFLEENSEECSKPTKLGDIAYTLISGRKDFDIRAGFICEDYSTALNALKNELSQVKNLQKSTSLSLIFVFSKINGEQCKYISHYLYETHIEFKQIIEDCFKIAYKHGVYNLNLNHVASFLEEKLLNFIIQYAIAQYLISIGVLPEVIIYDEFSSSVCAVLSGISSIETAIISIINNTSLDYALPNNYKQFDNVSQNMTNFENFLSQEFSSSTLKVFINILGIKSLENLNTECIYYDLLTTNRKQEYFIKNFFEILLFLWKSGINIKLNKVISSGKKIALPTYPFQKISYWLSKNLRPTLEKKSTNSESDYFEIESILLKIWQEVFDNPKITLTDRFYDIGGHSLIAIQIASRINESIGVKLDTTEILDGTSILELASFINSKHLSEKTPKCDILPVKKLKKIELSYAQQRMWMLEKIYPNLGICHVPIAFRIKGAIDFEMFCKSVKRLIQKHPALRTKFVFEDDKLAQYICDDIDFSVQYVKLTNKIDLHHIINSQINLAFDFSTHHLFRINFIEAEQNNYIVLFVFHHIIIDAWSFRVLLKDLNNFYQQIKNNLPEDNNNENLNYDQFVKFQQEFVNQSVEGKRQLDYWNQKLTSLTHSYFPCVLETSKDEKEKLSVGNFALTINHDLTEKLISFVKKNNVSMFVVLLAAYKLLISHYSDSTDVFVISPFANRHKRLFESTVGLFTNFVVLRSELSDLKCGKDLIETVKNVVLEAHSNSSIPFEVLISKNDIDLSSGFMFIMQEDHIKNSSFLGVTVEEKISLIPPAAPSLLCLEAVLQQAILSVNFVYSTQKFREKTIEEIGNYYQKILENIITPNSLLKNICPNNFAAENNEIQNIFQNYPLEKNLYELFSNVVKCCAYNIAIIEADEQQFSFKELSLRVDQIVLSLASIGIKQNDIVGICLKPSIDLIATILAILKIGAIYLPLDPSYPAKRLQYYIDDAKVHCMVTIESIMISLSLKIQNCLCLDQLHTKPNNLINKDITFNAYKQNPACLFYTSGSTGTPKGVLINHNSIINRCYWFNELCPVIHDEVYCLSTTINFVDSLAEIFTPLLFGRPLFIPYQHSIYNITDFLRQINVNKVTQLVLVPSLLSLILDIDNCAKYLKTVKRVICSGEVLHGNLANKFYSTLPNVKLFNFYGSTEVTADATYYVVPQNHAIANIPIGKNISNTKTFIFSKDYQLMPKGAPGFIFISGMCVADGYLNDTAATQEKFLTICINGCSYYLYNTGDIGYIDDDENLIYLGRKDSIYNIYGNRINTLEIETIINNHSFIHKCSVIVEDEVNRHIIAYVVLNNDGKLQTSQLIQACISKHVSQHLPQYMLPNKFMFLEEIPLTLNGKIDKNTLKLIQTATKESIVELSSTSIPKNSTELWLSNLCLKLLNVDDLDFKDNFFGKGGTSLILIRLIAEVESHFGIKLNFSQIFKDPTIQNIAALITDAKNDAEDTELVFSISQGNANNKCVLLFPPISGVSYEYTKLAPWLQNTAAYCLNYPFHNTDSSNFDTIPSLVEYYLSNLNEVIQKSDSISLIGYSFGGILALNAAQYLQHMNKTIDQIILIDTYYPTEKIKNKGFIEEQIEQALQLMNFEHSNFSKEKIQEVMRKNYKILSKHSLSAYSGSISLLKTSEYPKMFIDLWSKNISPNINIIPIPGHHYNLMSQENIEALSLIIQEILSGNGEVVCPT